MSALTRSIRGSSNQLLYHVLEEPQLLAAVRELPAPVLVRLINHVGLEDAGELIALTTTQQLGQVFDAELWQSAEPGADETFRPERFGLFLRLLYEAGESFVVERLLALPREFLVLAVHKLLLVVDIDALTVTYASSGRFYDDSIDRVVRAIDNALFEEWEEFRLIARDANAFEDLWNALLALDREDHELVRYIIERCCDMDGELIDESGLYAVLNEEELLENDLASERSDRRAAAGFIAPADARAFLELARRESVDEAPDGRDPIARAYFRELAPEQPSARPARALSAAQRSEADVGRLLAVLRDANVFEDEPVSAGVSRLLGDTKTANATRMLPKPSGSTKAKPARPSKGASKAKRTVAKEAIVQRTVHADTDTKTLTLMAAAMLELREANPALHAQRSEELGFLANVLVSGSRHDGRKYRPIEAIECALAVCSLALEERASAPAAAAKLLVELSADRLFRAGLLASRKLLGDRARANVATRLNIKLSDVPAAVSGAKPSLIKRLNLDKPAALALVALAEPEPWLNGRLSHGDHIFIASQKDTKQALEFLTQLEQHTEFAS